MKTCSKKDPFRYSLANQLSSIVVVVVVVELASGKEEVEVVPQIDQRLLLGGLGCPFEGLGVRFALLLSLDSPESGSPAELLEFSKAFNSGSGDGPRSNDQGNRASMKCASGSNSSGLGGGPKEGTSSSSVASGNTFHAAMGWSPLRVQLCSTSESIAIALVFMMLWEASNPKCYGNMQSQLWNLTQHASSNQAIKFRRVRLTCL